MAEIDWDIEWDPNGLFISTSSMYKKKEKLIFLHNVMFSVSKDSLAQNEKYLNHHFLIL